jgi:eukaryotic-like serine/threonine-protein kinase
MEGMLAPNGLPVIGAEIAGKYRIESVLGQGGMGAVFSAQNTLTGKRVAIKWLLPEQASQTSRERLLREARIAASIEHPNVVDIYDIGEHDGGLFLVMEYLRGQTLGDMLATRGRLDPQELIGMLIPVMRGVHFAHQCGIVHRDLKPENIIISEVDGQIVPKVLDFGVSKAISGDSIPHSTLTRTGALVGTPHYMALEQVDGSGSIDRRTDVYAFGVIVYRALTGHYPFDGSSLGEVILKIGTKDPTSMRLLRPELTADLEAVVLRAILRQRAARYGSVEELARALEPFAPGVRFRDSSDSTQRMGTSSVSRDLQPLLDASHPSVEASQPGLMRTPPARTLLPQHSRTRAFMFAAGAALVFVLGSLIWWLHRAPTVARAPVPPLADYPALEKLAPAAVVADRPVLADKPASAPPVEQPEMVFAPEERPGAAAPSTSDTEATTLAPKPRSVTAPASKKWLKGHGTNRSGGPKVVPGDRTKGLSADDF